MKKIILLVGCFALISILSITQFQACGKLATPGKTLSSVSGRLGLADCSAIPRLVYLAGETKTNPGRAITVLKYFPENDSLEFVEQIPITKRGFIRGFNLSPVTGHFIVGNDTLASDSYFGTSIGSANEKNLTLSGDLVSNVHGSCFLPNGNVIIGEFLGDKRAIEYDLSGNSVRDFFKTDLNERSALTYCHATRNGDVLFLEADSSFGGRVLRSKLQGNTWVTALDNAFDGAAFGTANGINVRLWSLGFDGDSYVYMGSILRETTGQLRAQKRFIRCPIDKLYYENCEEFGDELPEDEADQRLDAMTLIPGTKNFLFVTNRTLFKFESETGKITSLARLEDLVPDHRLVRYMNITNPW